MGNYLDIPENWPRELEQRLSHLTEDQAVDLLSHERKYAKQLLKCLQKDPKWTRSHASLLLKLELRLDPNDQKILALYKSVFEAVRLQEISKPQLTTQNCANLLSDAYFKDMIDDEGNPLEGNGFSTSMQFFVALLQQVKPSAESDEVKQQIDELSQKIEQAKQISDAIEKAVSTAYRSSVASANSSGYDVELKKRLQAEKQLNMSLTHIAQDISQRIKKLQPGESLLIPYGYQNYPNGHAMLCEISQDQDGSFQCVVFNTGDGLEYHHELHSTNKIYVSPVVVYKGLTVDEMTTDISDEFFLKIFLEPRTVRGILPKENPYSAKELYEGIFARFSGKIDPTPTALTNFITAQRAGSCSVRVLMAYMRVYVGESAYKELKFQMNKAAVTGMLADVEALKTDKARRVILKNGIESLCRSALSLYPELEPAPNNMPTSSSMVMEACVSNASARYPELREVVELSKSVEEGLEKTAPEPIAKSPVGEIPDSLTTDTEMHIRVQVLSYKEVKYVATAIVAEGIDSAPASDSWTTAELTVPFILENFQTGEDLHNYLDALGDFISKALMKGDIETVSFALHHVKTALLKMPLPISPRDTTSLWYQVADREECIDRLSSLMKGFITACPGNSLLPEEEIAVEKILAFAHFQACQLDRERSLEGIHSPRYLDELKVSRRYLKNLKRSAIMCRYRIELEGQIDALIHYFDNPDLDANASQLWDYENCYSVKKLKNKNERGPFEFQRSSGEWEYLSQFKSLLSDKDYREMEAFFKEVDDWEGEVRQFKLSVLVQALWVGKILGMSEDLQKNLEYVPKYFRQIVGLSLITNGLHQAVMGYQEPDKFDVNPQLVLPELRIIEGNKRLRQPTYVECVYSTKNDIKGIGAKPTETMSRAMNNYSGKYRKGGRQVSSNQRLVYWPLVDILDAELKGVGAYGISTDLKQINDLYLGINAPDWPLIVNPELKKILTAAIYSSTLRAPTTIYLLKELAESYQPGLQLMIALFLFSKDAMSRELELEPSFGMQLLDFVDQRSSRLLRQITEGKEQENGPESIHPKVMEYAFLQHLKTHVLERMKDLRNRGVSVATPSNLEEEIIRNRDSYHTFIKGIHKFCAKKTIPELYSTYISMFINTPPVDDGELSNIYLYHAYMIQPKDKQAENATNCFLWDNVKTVVSENLNRFRTRLEDSSFRNPFLKKALRSGLKINVSSKADWKGDYPRLSVIDGENHFSVDLTNWDVLINDQPLNEINGVYEDAQYQFLFGNKKFSAYTSRECHIVGKENEKFIRFDVQDDDGSAVRFIYRRAVSNGPYVIRQASLQIEKDFNQVSHAFIKWDDFHSALPIPLEKDPVNTSYELWRSLSGDNSLRIVDRETKTTVWIVNRDGSLSSEDSPGAIKYGQAAVRRNPALAFLANFADPSTILVLTRAAETDPPHFSVRFQKYRTVNGEVVSFTRKHITTTDVGGNLIEKSVLRWDNNPGYYIDEDQGISGLEGFSKYLVVRNQKGKRKLLVAASPITENTDEVMTIDLSKQGKLLPNTPKQRAYAAYLHLLHKDYQSAFFLLQKLYQLPRYSNEVLQLLGWILLADQTNKDYHPNAVAVRAYVGWLANDNIYRNHKGAKSLEAIVDLNSLKEPPEAWERFWENKASFQGDKTAKIIGDNYHQYLNLRKAVHSRLRFDTSRRGRRKTPIAHFEEVQFLHNLLKEDPNSRIINRLNGITSGFREQLRSPLIRDESFEGRNVWHLLESLPPLDEAVKEFRGIFPQTRHIRNDTDMRSILIAMALGPAETRALARNHVHEVNSRLRSGRFDNAGLILMLADETDTGRILREFVGQYKNELSEYKKNATTAREKDRFNELQRDAKDAIEGLIDRLLTERPSRRGVIGLGPSAPASVGFTAEKLPDAPPSKADRLQLQLQPIATHRDTAIFEKQRQPAKTHKALPRFPLPDAFARQRYAEFNEDYQKGIELNDHTYEYVYSDLEKVQDLKEATQQEIHTLDVQKQELKQAVLALANTLPPIEEEGKHLRSILQLGGGKRSRVTLEECVGAFVQARERKYRDLNPHLSVEQIQELHQRMADYLQVSIEVASMKKQLKAINKNDLQALGPLLEQQTAYDPNEYPAFLVFEHYMGFKIRPDQVRDIQKMMGEDGKFSDCIIQKIMGAGKTLVLGTLLSLLKADGYHLSVLIPPDSLYQVNAQDMKNRSDALFGQRTRTITLTRSPEHLAPSYLRFLKETIIRAIRDQEVLIVPPDVLQTIRNQYHALHYEVDLYPGRLEELKPSIEELRQILIIFKQRGVFTFDEVDLVLDPTKEHNFSLGIPTLIPKNEIDAIKELYVVAASELDFHLHENRHTEVTDQQYQTMRERFAQSVVNKLMQTPYWRKKFTLDEKRRVELERFFSNPQATTPKFIVEMFTSKKNIEGADMLVMMQQEICRWIPASFQSIGNVHYGLRAKQVAIPFRANNTPNDKADFSNRTEMMNRTFQAYLSSGLDVENVRALVNMLRIRLYAAYESRKVEYKIDQHPITLDFKRVFDLDLPHFDASKESSIHQIQSRLTSKDPKVVQFLLDYVADEQIDLSSGLGVENVRALVNMLKIRLYAKYKIDQHPIALDFKRVFDLDLPYFDASKESSIHQIQSRLTSKDPTVVQFFLDYVADEQIGREKIYTKQLNGTPRNLVNMPQVRQGYSGTINKDTLPVDPILEVGTNGKIADKLLSENESVLVSDAETVAEFIEDCLSDPSTYDFPALVDLGPRFKGVDSKEVALEILAFMKNHPERGIKGVLYWDDETEMLCCVKPGRENSPIVLPSSDPKTIYAVTELNQDELFVFFPHHKLTGADIPLPDGAKALFTVSEKTTLRDMFQGCFRMRKLFGSQRVRGVINSKMLDLIREKVGQWEGPIIIDQLFAFCFLNGVDKERSDLITSAVQELTATVEDYIDTLMLNSSRFDEEHEHFRRVQDLFIKDMEIHFFLMYGQKQSEKSMETYLTEKINELLKIAVPDHGKFMKKLPPDQQNLVSKLQALKAKILVKLPDTKVDRAQLELGANRTAIRTTEQTRKSETQTITESTRQSQAQSYRGTVTSAGIKQWPEVVSPDAVLFRTMKWPETVFGFPVLWKMDSVRTSMPEIIPFQLAMKGKIYTTENFVHTTSLTLNLFEEFAKPALEVLVLYDEKAKAKENPWSVVFLSSYDAEYFKENLPKHIPHMKNAMLLRPDMSIVQQGDLKMGSLSEASKNSLRKALIPVLFFKGDLETLNSREWIKDFRAWAAVDQDAKRLLFENKIIGRSDVLLSKYYGSKVNLALSREATPAESSASCIIM